MSHDCTYFFDDGDCTFLAEGVLFKVHKWMLSRDPESMFAESEPDIISLSDTSAEFRALCWGLYAPPNEIYSQSTPEADMDRLIDAAKMYHKYVLPSFESWALKMLVLQCKPPLDRLACIAPAVLERMMALASLCDQPTLFSLVEDAWLRRLHTVELPCSPALTCAEKYARRRFQAEVYYLLNTRLHHTIQSLSPCNKFDITQAVELGLTETQLLRLFSGHILLSNYWRHLRGAGLVYSTRCKMLVHMHDAVCVPAFKSIEWPVGTGDVRRGLEDVRDEVRRNAPPEPWGIQTCVGRYLDGLLERFEGDEMAGYFLGV
ncbi:hypothetical protein FB45DRAFT_895667 [Roridomyces roridus]|uniref:BTB domain-containing protein n=1 Tax=Roridomyces roridus TaxID=1738132 RepID=A0AAD7CA79_9AGAR|nr:hypothetical protein FB45DRAFT_895667 [Roridomyces roridus]